MAKGKSVLVEFKRKMLWKVFLKKSLKYLFLLQYV
jgi:hypothetical protein